LPVPRTGIAKRYAEAVFDSARDHGTFDRWLEELDAIARMQEEPVLGKLLVSPAVGMPAKEEMAKSYLGDVSPEALNLVRLLLHKGRLPLARQISNHYERLLNAHRGIATAHVTSAVELTAQELKTVAERLSAFTGLQMVVEATVDPAIIGGVVARIGDQLIDGSVRGRLELLKRRLASV